MNFDEVWAPIKSVIEYKNLDYEEAVTLGGQFGIMKKRITELEQTLSFYANKNNYDPQYGLKIYEDSGDLARRELER